MAERNVFHVNPSTDGRWIARMNDEGEAHFFASREAALRDARRSASRVQPSDVWIHRPDGSVEEATHYDARGDAEAEATATPSKAAIKGHPLHPVMVTFPLAFLLAAPAADVVFAVQRDLFWAEAAFWLLGAGVVTAVAAALIGLVDFVGLKVVRQTRAAWWHLFAVSGAVAVAAINLLLRVGNHADAVVPVGLVLSFVGAGVLVGGGWFGGELAYRHRIGVTR